MRLDDKDEEEDCEFDLFSSGIEAIGVIGGSRT